MNLSPSNAEAAVKDTPKAPLVLLQSLRAIAAGMVVFCHLGHWEGKFFPTSGVLPYGSFAGESGVDLFFVISGFIMMHITPKAHRSWRDQGVFLFRRFARIYPAYWAVAIPLLGVWFWNPRLIYNDVSGHVDVLPSLFLYPSVNPPVLFVGWTLICELTYYVIASFIFYLEGPTRMAIIALWFTVILGINIFHAGDFSSPWLNTFLVALTLEFIGGMILADFLRRGLGRIHPLVAAVLVVGSLSVMFVGGAWHGTFYRSPDHLLRIGIYGLPAFLIVWMILQMDIQGEWRWLTKLAPIGDRSYSLYLVHFPVTALVYRLAAGAFPGAGRVVVFGVMFAALAALIIPVECLHQWIEKPSHSLARNLTSRRGRPKRGPVCEAPTS